MSRWFSLFRAREPETAPRAESKSPFAPASAARVSRMPWRNDEALKRAGRRALAETLGVEAGALRAAPAADWQKTQVALRDLKQLPSLQRQAQRFARTLARDYCLLDEVVAEVGRDPALAVNVLRLANSVAVGSRERIGDLGTALQMLGVVRVRLMAQLLAAMEDARTVAPGFDWSHLWLHSAACSSLADRLGGWAGMRAGPELHVAALLHDVGKLALSAAAPEAYRGVLVEAWTRWQELPPLEEAWLGMDHREAGWIFGQEAELPPVVLSAIAYHDEPGRAPAEHRGVVALVGVANRLAKEHGLGFSGDGVPAAGELGASEVWRAWETALGRKLDAAELQMQMATEWMEPLRAELRSLHAVDAETV